MPNKRDLRTDMRRAPRLVIGLAGLLALAACAQGSVLTALSAGLFSGGGSGGASLDGNLNLGGSDVVLLGVGFTANAGQQMFATILDVASNHLLTEQAGFALVDSGGNFQLSWKNIVVPGQELDIAFYADVNSNAICNAIPTDNGWEVNLRTLNDGTVVAVTPAIAQRSVCELFGSYNVSFDSANGLSGHGYPGHNAYAGVTDMLDNSLVGEIQAGMISSTGEVQLSWPDLLVDHHHYVVAVCVDTADNGSCDSNALYTFSTNLVSADIAVRFASNTQPVSPRTFASYWPQNVTLPPPPVATVPTLNAP